MRSVIRGAAVCVCAHVGRTLTFLVAVILMCAHANAQSPAIFFVQSTQSVPQALASAVSVRFPAGQNHGNLNVVVVGWHDASADVLSVSDSDGNQYVLAVGPTVYPGVATQAMYYASGIVGSVSNPNTVTVTFTTPAAWADVRIAEYAGIATANPIDAVVAGLGSSGLSDSGTAGTSAANALLVAANTVLTVVTGAGPGFTQRGITLPSSNVLQDRVVSAPGTYNATASVAPGVPWIMQMVAFRAAENPDTESPTAPSAVSANAASSTQIDLAWTPSTDNVGVTSYLIERCEGAACTTFTPAGTSAGPTFSDTGLIGSTTYRYRVRAADAANNLSGYSNVATATTPASPDTQAPTAPGTLTATAASGSAINLTWTASTDNVGVTSYLVERCQGAGCTTFAQVGTSATASFSDTGLTNPTTYRYQVRAADAANNLSGYSNVATATTPDTQAPTAPGTLTATAASSSAINLTWTASTDNVGVTSYLVERCQGAGCTTFAQIGTSTTASFGDTGLTNATAYRYQVRATDAAANLSGYSNVATATTPDTQAPTAPGTLTATAASSSAINLTWTAATDNVGVTSYLVERCQGAGCTTFAQIGTSTTASFGDTGLTNATAYRYQVRASDAAANLSGYSNVATATTPDTQAPTAPGTLTATAASGSAINLTWTAATDNVGVTSYLVERCQGAGCTTFAQIGTSTTASFGDTGLTNATAYRYQVRATDAAANLSGYSNVATATTPDTQAPTAPGTLTATAASGSAINLTWTAATDNVGVTSYLVERCQGAGCTTFAQIGTSTTASFGDTGLTNATAYRYQVRASDAAANLSGYSNVATATTPDTQAPTAPGTLTATAASGSAINLTWTAATDNVGVTSYLVERCQGAGCTTFAQIGTSTTASFGDTGLTNATTYRYQVRATDAANNLSGYSNVASATTPAPPDTQAPTTPGAFSGAATSSSQVSLTWTASSDNVGVAGYRVSRDSILLATVTTLSYADSGLNASTTYNYSVVAFDAAGNPSAPATTSVTTQAASPPPPFVLASDNFNRANGGPGAGWTVIDSNPRIVNQHIEETNASDGVDSIAIYTGLTWPADHYSQVTVRAASAHSGASAVVRAKNDPVIEMYFVYVTGPLGPGARLTLAKFVTNNYTELWTSVLPVNAGDALYLSVQGTTLTVKLNGTTLTTQTDGSITAAGYPGFDITDYDGQGVPGDGQLDDWFAGNFGGTTGGPVPKGGWTLVSVDSQETACENAAAVKAFDGSAATKWHTRYCPSSDPLPHEIQIDMGTGYQIGAFRYLPRQDGSSNGRIGQFELYATNNLSNWGAPLATGTFANSATEQQVSFAPNTYRYIRFRALTEVNGNRWTAVAELSVDSVGGATITAPTNVAPTATTSTEIDLAWTASTASAGVAGYNVFRNGALAGTTVTTAFADTGLAPSTTYTYTVTGFDTDGTTSAPSTPTAVTTQSSSTPPPSVSSLTLSPPSVTGGGSSQATVTLSGPAPSGGAVVTLGSSNQAVAAVPGSVTVAAGATSAVFTVNTSAVATATLVTISGSYQGSTASAVLTVSVPGGAVPKGGWTLVSVDSQETACENAAAVKAFDGSAATKWHTRYCPSSDPLPHEIQIDMGAGYQIGAFRYLPRQDGSSNGRIGQFEFYATNNLSNWGAPLATGTFANSATEQQVSFAPNTYRYIRFRALTEVNGNRWTAVAELSVDTTPAPPDTQAPTAPGTPVPVVLSSTQIGLTWTASTDNVAVTGYLLERCQGAGCSSFAQIATPAGTSFNDTGLLASTSYSYRVLATDAAANLSAYSGEATRTTAAPGTDPPFFSAETHSDTDGCCGLQYNNSTLTMNVSGTNRLLMLTWHSEWDGWEPRETPDPGAWTVTNNGVPGTVIADTNGYWPPGVDGNRRFRIYYWLNPPLGINTVRVSNPNTGANELSVSAMLFTNVDQTNPLGEVVVNVSTSERTAESETLQTVPTDLVVHAIANGRDNLGGSLGPGETSRAIANDTFFKGDASLWISTKPGAAPTTTVSSSGWDPASFAGILNAVAFVLHGSSD